MKKVIILFFVCLQHWQSHAQFDLMHLQVQVDSPWTYRNFQLIPIRFKLPPYLFNNAAPFTPINLETALAEKKIIIKEINYMGGADVKVLVIKNISNQPILISSGDLLMGGKQDRVVAETKILMPGKQEDYLSVFCTEKNRWSKKPLPFSYGGKADIRLKRKVDIVKKQPDIWKEISEQLINANIKSATEQYARVIRKLNKADSAYLAYFINRFAETDSSYAGFIALSGNNIICTEIFAAPQLLIASYNAMLNSFIAGRAIITNTSTLSKINLNEYIENLLGSAKKQEIFLQKHGVIYRFNGQAIHLVAFGN